ncbi:MAG: hypothetical protein ACPGJI_06645 [Kangiellaceae bacterium]
MSQSANQITLLQLAAAQLAISLKETEQPFDDLSKLFIEIVEGFNEIESLLSSGNSTDLERVKDLHSTTQGRVKNAVIDFQFYDRMTQRLNHILSNIQDAIDSMGKCDSVDDEYWQEIFAKIEKSYTMREEKQLYESIRSGIGFDEAVKALVSQTFDHDSNASNIELF